MTPQVFVSLSKKDQRRERIQTIYDYKYTVGGNKCQTGKLSLMLVSLWHLYFLPTDARKNKSCTTVTTKRQNHEHLSYQGWVNKLINVKGGGCELLVTSWLSLSRWRLGTVWCLSLVLAAMTGGEQLKANALQWPWLWRLRHQVKLTSRKGRKKVSGTGSKVMMGEKKKKNQLRIWDRAMYKQPGGNKCF